MKKLFALSFYFHFSLLTHLIMKLCERPRTTTTFREFSIFSMLPKPNNIRTMTMSRKRRKWNKISLKNSLKIFPLPSKKDSYQDNFICSQIHSFARCNLFNITERFVVDEETWKKAGGQFERAFQVEGIKKEIKIKIKMKLSKQTATREPPPTSSFDVMSLFNSKICTKQQKNWNICCFFLLQQQQLDYCCWLLIGPPEVSAHRSNERLILTKIYCIVTLTL